MGVGPGADGAKEVVDETVGEGGQGADGVWRPEVVDVLADGEQGQGGNGGVGEIDDHVEVSLSGRADNPTWMGGCVCDVCVCG